MKYYLILDYVSLRVRLTLNDVKYYLHELKTSELRVLKKLSKVTDLVSRKAFKRLIRKGANPFLYIVRLKKAEKLLKLTSIR